MQFTDFRASVKAGFREREIWVTLPPNPLGDTTPRLSPLAKHLRSDDPAGLFDSDAFARATPQIARPVADGRNFSRALGFD